MSTFFRRKKTWITSAHQGFVKGEMHSNTLAAYALAAQKGADMIETDARMTSDGVIIVNHDPIVCGFDENNEIKEYVISETDYGTIAKLHLVKNGTEKDKVPTLEQTLDFAYKSGMCVNIDLKEGIKNAARVAELVINSGMRGRVVYATNASGAEAINLILSIDPEARFIDTPLNFTREKLQSVRDYPSKCYAYTGDFSEENISKIRASGCMLAAISLNESNAKAAFAVHPDMAEYPHTSDFEEIEKSLNL